MTTFLPIRTDDDALAGYARLLAACFPGTRKFTGPYLQWLYRDNPDGAALGFDAWDGDQLAAHYVCIAARAVIDGAAVPVPVLLSLNTATHPAYQGRGLFTRLAALTYAAGAGRGCHGVYGVANAHSTPGFVRKLGFQLVRPLEARIGCGRLPPRAPGALSFVRHWDQASLAWRAACPGKPLDVRRCGPVWQFRAPALPLVHAYAELAASPEPDWSLPGVGGARWGAAPLRLFLGLRPAAGSGGAVGVHGVYGAYLRIPQRLRPSPLNLIYLPLAEGSVRLAPEAIDFSFLDFDAY
ncbi:GNAT family acetyltransferase [Duganella sp. Leaf126]|uniref:GNAT family N-acetyltransferase n=1 Tax=Duganella sp. Leaf126 TaxID=1736266 RepID=UPI000700D8FA|nr:GNAT family N-acetyltransferase [Duganella sp. Leaf126]KQQ33672.1 GNAT family acetyltransferase [Duganella sp. Leaf126]